jgi:hypothetical protein
MKYVIMLYVQLFVNLFVITTKSDIGTTFRIAEREQSMLNIVCPLRSSQAQLVKHNEQILAHRQKTIERRREEFKTWKSNNMLLFAG